MRITPLEIQNHRFSRRLSGLDPDEVVGPLTAQITDIEVWRNPKSKLHAPDASVRSFEGVNKRHWWLVATVT